MKKMILVLILAATCTVPALADEKEYYSALAAFQMTSASSDYWCQQMIGFANSPVQADYMAVAFSSLKCYHQVQAEAGGELPEAIPRAVFISTCPHLRARLAYIKGPFLETM